MIHFSMLILSKFVSVKDQKRELQGEVSGAIRQVKYGLATIIYLSIPIFICFSCPLEGTIAVLYS